MKISQAIQPTNETASWAEEGKTAKSINEQRKPFKITTIATFKQGETLYYITITITSDITTRTRKKTVEIVVNLKNHILKSKY